MFGILRTARAARSFRPLPHTRIRTFAQEVPPKSPSDSSSPATKTDVALRDESSPPPEHAPAVEVDAGILKPATRASRRRDREIQAVEPRSGELRPQSKYKIIGPKEHGLYAFFRQSKNKAGEWYYTNVSAKDPNDLDTNTGRSWSAPELRRKSFKDLHMLWYILLRERNLLATQKEECRRIGVPNIMAQTDIGFKTQQCRKSMARIKYVLNERRITYEGALELFAQDKARGEWGATKKEAEDAALAAIREKKQKRIQKQQRYQEHVKSRAKAKEENALHLKGLSVKIAGQMEPRDKVARGATKESVFEAGVTESGPVQTEASSP